MPSAKTWSMPDVVTCVSHSEIETSLPPPSVVMPPPSVGAPSDRKYTKVWSLSAIGRDVA